MPGSQATPASCWLWPRGGGQRLGSGRWLRQQRGGPSLIPEGALGCSRLPFLGLAASLLPGTGSWLFLPRAGVCVCRSRRCSGPRSTLAAACMDAGARSGAEGSHRSP